MLDLRLLKVVSMMDVYMYELTYWEYEAAEMMPDGLPSLPLASDLLAPRDEFGQVIGAGW
jgi:hypothetical protein